MLFSCHAQSSRALEFLLRPWSVLTVFCNSLCPLAAMRAGQSCHPHLQRRRRRLRQRFGEAEMAALSVLPVLTTHQPCLHPAWCCQRLQLAAWSPQPCARQGPKKEAWV